MLSLHLSYLNRKYILWFWCSFSWHIMTLDIFQSLLVICMSLCFFVLNLSYDSISFFDLYVYSPCILPVTYWLLWKGYFKKIKIIPWFIWEVKWNWERERGEKKRNFQHAGSLPSYPRLLSWDTTARSQNSILVSQAGGRGLSIWAIICDFQEH